MHNNEEVRNLFLRDFGPPHCYAHTDYVTIKGVMGVESERGGGGDEKERKRFHVNVVLLPVGAKVHVIYNISHHSCRKKAP